MNWFRKLLASIKPWSPALEIHRARPLRLREATAADLEHCERLHIENERFGVPTNHRRFYSEALRAGDMLTLVAEEEGQVVGTCGVQRENDGLFWLCYALVSPQRHHTGIGTTMFLARLAMLPAEDGDIRTRVGISALETSMSFYRRFGFKFVGRGDFPDGNRYPICFKDDVDGSMVKASRALLKSVGAVLLCEGVAIPTRKAPNQSALPTPV